MTSRSIVPVLTAVTGAAWESAVVAALESRPRGISVVRRCVDVADLVAAATAGHGRAVLVSADLRRLDQDVVARLRTARVAVVGVVAPGDEPAARRLREIGIDTVVAADAGAGDVAAAVIAALATPGATTSPVPAAPRDARRGARDPADADVVDRKVMGDAGMTAEGIPHDASGLDRQLDDIAVDARPAPRRSFDPGWSDPMAAARLLGRESATTDVSGDLPALGRLVAVWGPTGAPGRTTVAVNLAAEIAASGVSTLLADADTYGAAVAAHLGMLDEAPGLAAAARAAGQGSLDVAALARHARQLSPRLRVLTGISRPERWSELRAPALETVWARCRAMGGVTVVDCGFSLEADEELSFDTVAPRRNGATLVTLEQADVVVAVGSAEPVGMARLVRGLGALREVVPTAATHVVVNRVRASAIGGDPDGQIRRALDRFAGVRAVTLVPYDRAALDAALLHGRTLAEAAPSSPARRAIQELVPVATGRPAPVRAGRGRRKVRPVDSHA